MYMDDIILTATSDDILRGVIATLTSKLCTKDLGGLHHFLGITVTHKMVTTCLTVDILDWACMAYFKSCGTPIDTSAKHAIIASYFHKKFY